MSDNTPMIVMIEDEPQMRRFVRTALDAQGYRFAEADTGSQGLVEIAIRKPDLLILDLGLPDMDGVEVVRQLREWSSLPVIVLSARMQEADKIAALDAGADDYLIKPFSVGELLARIRVGLRHGARNDDTGATEFCLDNLRVDLVRRPVFLDDEPVHLTPIEYRLLSVLVRYAGRVLTHRQLLKEVWGPAYVENNHYLRIYMGQLRHKLEASPADPRFLLTEAGVGYRLAAE